MAKCEHDKVRQSCATCKPELVYRAYQYKAVKQRKLAFTLTLDEFKKLVSAECFYCGVTPATGVDRRENGRGYIFSENPILNNCQACCGTCNKIKGTFGHHFLMNHIDKMCRHAQK